MKRMVGASLCLMVLGSGCATKQQPPWTPTVDTFANSRSQYVAQDLAECEQLALQATGQTVPQGVRATVVGGLIGAATGAAIGAGLGSPGRGAAIGGAAGGVGLGATRIARSETAFRQAYSNCMRQRGHNIVSSS